MTSAQPARPTRIRQSLDGAAEAPDIAWPDSGPAETMWVLYSASYDTGPQHSRIIPDSIRVLRASPIEITNDELDWERTRTGLGYDLRVHQLPVPDDVANTALPVYVAHQLASEPAFDFRADVAGDDIVVGGVTYPRSEYAPDPEEGARRLAAVDRAAWLGEPTEAHASPVAAPTAGPEPVRDATWLAERALMDTLLRGSERIADLPWLTAADFADPHHGAVFATIAGLHARGELLPVSDSTIGRNLVLIQAALQARTFYQVNDDWIPVGDLVGAAPPSSSSLHTLYARKVLESSARRQISGWGTAFASVDTVPADDLHEGMATAVLDLQRRVTSAIGWATPETTAIDGLGAPLPLPPAEPNPKLVERAERAVLAGVLNDTQGELAVLLDRIQPDDLTHSPEHQNTWRAMQAVARRGDPVNYVTVAWEAERVVSAHQPILPLDELAALDAPGGDLTRQVNVISRASLHQRFKQASDDLVAATRQPGQDVTQLLRIARQTASTLQDHARRLTTSSAPSPTSQDLDDPAAYQQPSETHKTAGRTR
jgi:replicative DNA helicase